MNSKIFRIISLIVAIFSSALMSSHAQNSNKCGTIQDPDQRAMCRALADRNSSQCGLIKNDDQRVMCRAQLDRNSSQCGLIKNNDLRNTCRALSGS